jgi:hypothetical protein
LERGDVDLVGLRGGVGAVADARGDGDGAFGIWTEGQLEDGGVRCGGVFEGLTIDAEHAGQGE